VAKAKTISKLKAGRKRYKKRRRKRKYETLAMKAKMDMRDEMA